MTALAISADFRFDRALSAGLNTGRRLAILIPDFTRTVPSAKPIRVFGIGADKPTSAARSAAVVCVALRAVGMCCIST